MFVAREGLSNPLVLHDDERQTVRQRPVFVVALLEEIHTALEKAGARRNDFDTRMIEKRAIECYEIGTVGGVGIRITKLREHPFGGENVQLRVAGKFKGLDMTILAGIK